MNAIDRIKFVQDTIAVKREFRNQEVYKVVQFHETDLSLITTINRYHMYNKTDDCNYQYGKKFLG